MMVREKVHVAWQSQQLLQLFFNVHFVLQLPLALQLTLPNA
jgi:hypothetical protein